MEDALILQELEALAAELEIEVRYEDLDGAAGGLCKVRGRQSLILDRTLLPSERVSSLSRALARCPFEELFVRPHVRALLESHRPPTGS